MSLVWAEKIHLLEKKFFWCLFQNFIPGHFLTVVRVDQACRSCLKFRLHSISQAACMEKLVFLCWKWFVLPGSVHSWKLVNVNICKQSTEKRDCTCIVNHKLFLALCTLGKTIFSLRWCRAKKMRKTEGQTRFLASGAFIATSDQTFIIKINVKDLSCFWLKWFF